MVRFSCMASSTGHVQAARRGVKIFFWQVRTLLFLVSTAVVSTVVTTVFVPARAQVETTPIGCGISRRDR